MNSPLFSILIANYNNGKYLLEAVESIVNQTYLNWQIIIVDDYSTDNSSEIYKQFATEKRIKVYFNEQNQGCGYTKWRCAELATGELCGYLDPDDALTPDALEIMVAEHEKNPNASVVCSRYYLCNDAMKIIQESGIRNKNIKSYLTEAVHAPETFAAFKTKLYRASKGLNPTYKRAIDQDLYYLLEEQGEMRFIDNLLYKYRFRSDSLSHGDYKAMYWRVVAAQDAALRRGLRPEDVVDKIFNDVFTAENEKYEKVKNSSYYKLGFKLIHPVERTWRRIKKKVLKIFPKLV
jgi:glycosyltransferase involved in cell wall biosynthesis